MDLCLTSADFHVHGLSVNHYQPVAKEAKMIYHTGQVAPESGEYEVVNDPNHRCYHEITMVAGKQFPPCRNCGHPARYRLARPARHLSGR